MASLSRPAGGPPCGPPLCHPVAEGWLASMGWVASGGPLEGRWCYVCRVGIMERCKSCNKYNKNNNNHLTDTKQLHTKTKYAIRINFTFIAFQTSSQSFHSFSFCAHIWHSLIDFHSQFALRGTSPMVEVSHSGYNSLLFCNIYIASVSSLGTLQAGFCTLQFLLALQHLC